MKAVAITGFIILGCLTLWLIKDMLDTFDNLASKQFDYDIVCEMAEKKHFYSLGGATGEMRRGLFGGSEVIYVFNAANGKYYLPASRCLVSEKERK